MQWSLIAYMRQHGKEVSRGRKGNGKARRCEKGDKKSKFENVTMKSNVGVLAFENYFQNKTSLQHSPYK